MAGEDDHHAYDVDRKENLVSESKSSHYFRGSHPSCGCFYFMENTAGAGENAVAATSDGTIRWVDFNVSYEALCKAYEYDVETYGKKIHIDWIDLLSYVAAKMAGSLVHPQCRS